MEKVLEQLRAAWESSSPRSPFPSELKIPNQGALSATKIMFGVKGLG